jgi:riboflavin biosynthesis pyrimidine reductase
VQYGIGPVTDGLLQHDLLDELRLWVHPFMVGRGSASDLLFRDGRTAHLALANAEALASGIVVITYTA